MDKKFCDKCKEEIKKEQKYYLISIWEYAEEENNDPVKEIEYCSACYEKIVF